MVYLNLRSRTFRDVESFCSEIVGYLRLQTTVFPTSVTATGTYGGVELEVGLGDTEKRAPQYIVKLFITIIDIITILHANHKNMLY